MAVPPLAGLVGPPQDDGGQDPENRVHGNRRHHEPPQRPVPLGGRGGELRASSAGPAVPDRSAVPATQEPRQGVASRRRPVIHSFSFPPISEINSMAAVLFLPREGAEDPPLVPEVVSARSARSSRGASSPDTRPGQSFFAKPRWWGGAAGDEVPPGGGAKPHVGTDSPDGSGQVEPSCGAVRASSAGGPAAATSFFAVSRRSLSSRRARETRLLIVPT